MHYVLSFREFRRLRPRARAAQQRDQSEVCGALRLGSAGQLSLCFVRNRSPRSGSWKVRWDDLLRAGPHRNARLVGMFHSHPVSHPELGPSDRRATPHNWLHLVYDVCGVTAKFWRVRKIRRRRRVHELPLVIERSPS